VIEARRRLSRTRSRLRRSFKFVLRYDGSIRVWNGTKNVTFPTGADVMSVALSADGEAIISGGLNEVVEVRDIKSGRVIKTISDGVDGFVYAVAALPGGKTILSAGAYGRVQLWDLASGDLIRAFNGTSLYAKAVAVTPDGSTFVVGDDSDHGIRVFRCKARGEWPARLCSMWQ
jgi:WD40 repeat protein